MSSSIDRDDVHGRRHVCRVTDESIRRDFIGCRGSLWERLATAHRLLQEAQDNVVATLFSKDVGFASRISESKCVLICLTKDAPETGHVLTVPELIELRHQQNLFHDICRESTRRLKVTLGPTGVLIANLVSCYEQDNDKQELTGQHRRTHEISSVSLLPRSKSDIPRIVCTILLESVPGFAKELFAAEQVVSNPVWRICR